MRCLQCGHDNPPTARFCGACGANQELACPSCGIAVDAGQKFCTGCGTGLPPATHTSAGAELPGTPHVYIAWLFVLDGIPIPAIAWWRRGPVAVNWVRANWRSTLAGGAMSLTAYGMVIWALTLAALAPVAALRETGVIFAAALSSLVLKERFGARRIASACLVAAGVIVLRLA